MKLHDKLQSTAQLQPYQTEGVTTAITAFTVWLGEHLSVLLCRACVVVSKGERVERVDCLIDCNAVLSDGY